jgi:cobalt-zinc-cadmium efflux system outer membrane protein
MVISNCLYRIVGGVFAPACMLLIFAVTSVSAQVAAPLPPPSSIEAPGAANAEPYAMILSNMRPADMAQAEAPSGAMTPLADCLSLGQLEQIALAHNPTLCQAAMRVRAAEGQLVQAGLYPNPVAGYMGEEMGADGTAGFQGAFVGQEFVTGGKLKLSRAVAAQEVRQAQWAWQAQKLRVLNDVRSGYFDVLSAQQTIEINEQLVRIGEEVVRTAERMFAAKEVSLVDILQAKVETDMARIALQIARNKHRAVWEQLAAVVGMPNMSPCMLAGRLQDDLPQLDWGAVLGQTLSASPELAEARAGVQRAQCQVARQYAERVPNVDVRATAQYDNEVAQNIATVEVGLPLPLWNRNQGNITKAESQLIAAQYEVRRVELDLRQRLAPAFERYQNARDQAQKYSEDILPNAAKTLELTRLGYQQGEFNYQALLIAQRTYFQANLSYLESLRELRVSAVALEGMVLSGGLQAAFNQQP